MAGLALVIDMALVTGVVGAVVYFALLLRDGRLQPMHAFGAFAGIGIAVPLVIALAGVSVAPGIGWVT